MAVVSTWNNGGTMLRGVHTYAVQKLENGLWWYNYNTRKEVVLQSGKYVGIKDTVQATLEADNYYPAFVVGYIVE